MLKLFHFLFMVDCEMVISSLIAPKIGGIFGVSDEAAGSSAFLRDSSLLYDDRPTQTGATTRTVTASLGPNLIVYSAVSNQFSCAKTWEGRGYLNLAVTSAVVDTE